MSRRLHLFRGRVLLYIEPRDLWTGAYIAEDYVYLCPLPTLVIRVDRDWSALDWKPPRRDRANAVARWQVYAGIIRARRIRTAPQHLPFGSNEFGFHSQDPGHCVCNGTHTAAACTRCDFPDEEEPVDVLLTWQPGCYPCEMGDPHTGHRTAVDHFGIAP